MNVLVVAAHFDDAEIGCGGTMAQLAEQGHSVNVLVLTESGYHDELGKQVRDSSSAGKEGLEATRILGVNLVPLNNRFKVFELHNNDGLRRPLLIAIKELNIDTLFCHWYGDVHADHVALSGASVMSARHLPRVAMYRSNNYDGGNEFSPSLYVDISKTFDKKITAIRSFNSEYQRAGDEWIEILTAQHRLDGLKTGVKFAESFRAVRWLL